MGKGILILGATSSIARGVANAFAERGFSIYLGGRESDELERIASDITVRYNVPTHFSQFDAERYFEHEKFVDDAERVLGGIDGVLIAFGDLGSHSLAIHDFSETHRIIARNYTGACSVLTHIAGRLEKKGSGFIIGIASVAGDRGRQSNYIYGSAKGGFSLFLQGLRNRLYSSGVHVMTVKPGFVDTAMTYGLPGIFLAANPADVGRKIVLAVERRKDVLYIPTFWKWIMGVITAIPEMIFKRLKL